MLVLIIPSIWYLDLDKVFDKTNILFKINTGLFTKYRSTGLFTKDETLETVVQNLYSSTTPCNCTEFIQFFDSLQL